MSGDHNLPNDALGVNLYGVVEPLLQTAGGRVVDPSRDRDRLVAGECLPGLSEVPAVPTVPAHD